MLPPSQIESVRWQDIPGPTDYDPASVAPALRAIGNVTDLRSLENVSNKCLYSFGNNHRGTLFPAAVWAAPFLVWYAVAGTGWTRFAALDILMDAVCFDADGDHLEVENSTGKRVGLQQGVREVVAAQTEALLKILGDESEFDEVRALALSLLDVLNTNLAHIRGSLERVVIGASRPRLGERGGRRTFDIEVAAWRAENPE